MPKPTFFNLPEDKRNHLIDLAVEEFAAHDYRNASISALVEKAGIAKGSLYQYFGDKRDLYFYLLELAAAEKKAFLAQVQPPDPAQNLFDHLRWMVREGVRFELARPRLAQVAYRALFSDRPFGDEPFEQFTRVTQDYFMRLIELGICQGSIDPQVDRGLAVFFIGTLFNEFGRYLLEQAGIDPLSAAKGEPGAGEIRLEEQVDRLIDLIENGLAPRSPYPSRTTDPAQAGPV